MRFLIALSLLVSLAATSTIARPHMRETVTTYPVSGANPEEIRRYLDENGPNGSWGYTNWELKWSGNCIVQLRVYYVRPELINRDIHSGSYLAAWDQMIVALIAHQKLYGDHGRGAAIEVERRGCRRTDPIIDKWLEQDRLLQAEEQINGAPGVNLP